MVVEQLAQQQLEVGRHRRRSAQGRGEGRLVVQATLQRQPLLAGQGQAFVAAGFAQAALGQQQVAPAGQGGRKNGMGRPGLFRLAEHLRPEVVHDDRQGRGVGDHGVVADDSRLIKGEVIGQGDEDAVGFGGAGMFDLGDGPLGAGFAAADEDRDFAGDFV